MRRSMRLMPGLGSSASCLLVSARCIHQGVLARGHVEHSVARSLWLLLLIQFIRGHKRMDGCDHLTPRRMFQAICAISVPLFRISDHLFMDARANLRFSTRGANLINSKHHTHRLRCFGAAGSIQMMWIGPLG